MYVCTFVYVCICVYVCVVSPFFTNILSTWIAAISGLYIYTYTAIVNNIYIFIYLYLYLYLHVCLCPYLCVCVCGQFCYFCMCVIDTEENIRMETYILDSKQTSYMPVQNSFFSSPLLWLPPTISLSQCMQHCLFAAGCLLGNGLVDRASCAWLGARWVTRDVTQSRFLGIFTLLDEKRCI